LKTTLDSSFQKIRLIELYLRNVGANLLGFFIIALLNLFTPLEFFKIQKAFLLAGGWMVILALYPFVICIGITLQYIVQRPITQMINRMRQGLNIEAALKEKARRRILNLPVTIGLINLVMWVGLTALLGSFFLIFRDATLKMGFFVQFRGFMVGYISAILSFYLVEAYSRRRLVRKFGREFLIFSIVLCVIFFFVGGRLNVLSGKSIIQPITDMMVLVRRVRKGHFKQKVRVVSNDELGVLGDGLNEMIEGLIERDQIRESLHLAEEVQQTLLPRQNPNVDGLDIAATIVYCDETGGDYYDYLDTRKTYPGSFTMAIGDVSGHGIPSALMMATARAFLRQRSVLPGTPADIVSDVNHQITRDFEESGGFMTLFYLSIDRANRSLCWVRAGHDPAIFYDPAIDKFDELRGVGMALGVDAGGCYKEFKKSNLKEGQVIILGSDGLWEARNPRGEMFGKEPVHQIIRQSPAATAREILTACFNHFNVFLGDRAPEDDVTLVVIKLTKE